MPCAPSEQPRTFVQPRILRHHFACACSASSPAALLDELAGRKPPLVVDVRSRREYAAGRLDGAINIPLEELRDRLAEVPRDSPVVVQCQSGYRSYLAQQILRNRGYANVLNLMGGLALTEQVQRTRVMG